MVEYVDLPLALTRQFRLYRIAVTTLGRMGLNGCSPQLVQQRL